MNNEFYAVELSRNDFYFFKSKDKAFEFLWQEYLNEYAVERTQEELAAIKEDMYFWYAIDDFGSVVVCGFED